MKNSSVLISKLNLTQELLQLILISNISANQNINPNVGLTIAILIFVKLVEHAQNIKLMELMMHRIDKSVKNMLLTVHM